MKGSRLVDYFRLGLRLVKVHFISSISHQYVIYFTSSCLFNMYISSHPHPSPRTPFLLSAIQESLTLMPRDRQRSHRASMASKITPCIKTIPTQLTQQPKSYSAVLTLSSKPQIARERAGLSISSTVPFMPRQSRKQGKALLMMF